MTEMNAKLIAPCGMNCRLCYSHIRARNQCMGCRSLDTNCRIVNCEKRIQNGWSTCAHCDKPCRRLRDLDERYKSKFHMSMIENLTVIRNHDMEYFLQEQKEKYSCSVCGKIISVHRNECPSCKTPVW